MFRIVITLFLNLVLLLFAGVVSLGLGEAFVRLAYPEFGEPVSRVELVTEFDALLGWRKIPHARKLLKKKEFEVVEAMNSKGLRGPEYSFRKRDNEYRILVLGDSFVEGYSVDFSDLFTEQLKRMLNAQNDGTDYEVINGGTGGYSTDQELLFYMHEGKRYSPDLVVVMFYSNDVWYNNQERYWRGYKPLFKFRNQDLVLSNLPLPKVDPSHGKKKKRKKKKKNQGLIKSILNSSYLYTFVLHRMKKNYDLHQLAIRLGLLQKPKDIDQKVIKMKDVFRVYKTTYEPDIQAAWKITETLLEQFNTEVSQSNSQSLR